MYCPRSGPSDRERGRELSCVSPSLFRAPVLPYVLPIGNPGFSSEQ